MRMTIKAKLAGAFALVLILFGVTAFVALTTLGDTQNSLEKLVDRSAERVRLAGNIKEEVLTISRSEKNIILASTVEEMDAEAAIIAEARNRLRDMRERLRNLASNEGQRTLDEFATSIENYYAISDRVRKFTRLNSNTRARHVSSHAARDQLNLAMDALKVIRTAVERSENLNSERIWPCAWKRTYFSPAPRPT